MSTDLKTSPPVPSEQQPTPDRPRLNLSANQVVASALAAVTATVAASYLGIAGTVIGAGVASVVTVIGNAVYGHSIARIRPGRTAALPIAPIPAPAPPRRRAWTHFLASCLGVFAGVLIVVTGVELVAGKPLADVVRGDSGSGTSVLGTTGGAGGTTTPSPAVTITVTPTVVTATPTVTVTGSAVTSTVTPTTTTTKSATDSGSASTSPSSSPSTSTNTSGPSATPTDTPTPSRTDLASAG